MNSLAFRTIETELSSDNFSSYLKELYNRLAPGTIQSAEEIAMVEFVGQWPPKQSIPMKLTLRREKEVTLKHLNE